MKPRVLFVCVENSCRSQIAEGFAKKLGADRVEAWGAGSKPSGKVNERAIEFMQERGIDITMQRSKGFAGLPQGGWDCVVTMGCGDACPFIRAKKRLDWALPDPKNLPAAEFRQIVDEIEKRVKVLLRDLAAAV